VYGSSQGIILDFPALSLMLFLMCCDLSHVLWRVQELNHGRLAMIAAVGTCTHHIHDAHVYGAAVW
jgi:hypothetical protein